MTYALYEHDRVKKFFKKHKHDKSLLLRITKKYHEILNNPYDGEFLELNSVKCPKCHRARVGNYRIIFKSRVLSPNSHTRNRIDLHVFF